MITRPVVVALLAAGCVGAAGGGAYLAVRRNAAEPAHAAAVQPTAATPVSRAVEETEAVVAPEPEGTPPLVAPVSGPPAADAPPRAVERPAASTPNRARKVRPAPVEPRVRQQRVDRPVAPAARESEPAPLAAPASPPVQTSSRPADDSSTGGPNPVVPAYLPPPSPARTETPAAVAMPAAPEREFIQLVVPASSVIGLQIETAVTTERARVEDRVDARVTRDVMADGHVAIPAGSRVIGSVTLVEPGGKIKERARLGVRFHTIVFADGSELPIRTEPIYRDGESPSAESTKKIGGAAVGGAILGAIIGGGKGAMIGGAAGAAGGTAATMAGGRNPATLPAGAIVTIRLSEPLTLDRERQQR